MKPSDPALDRLAVAKQMLLDPSGLDEAKLPLLTMPSSSEYDSERVYWKYRSA